MARIVYGGFQHETNTFASDLADLDAFKAGGGWPGIKHEGDIWPAIQGANIPAGGFVGAALEAGDELIGTIWAAASPSAHVTDDAFEYIAGHIVNRIRAALPVDAVYLDLHGAMVTQSFDDGEGELLRRVREVVGDSVPVIASLDLHTNVTAQMLEQADMLAAYRTYPHVDMSDTGARAYAWLQKRFALGRRFNVSKVRLPFMIPICWQSTDLEPAASLYEQLAELERDDVYMSFAMGFPAADFAECSPVIWAYAADQADAERAANTLSSAVMAVEADFAGKLYEPDEAVLYAMQQAGQSAKPIIIADAQDNPGAGSNSDTTGMLKALHRNKAKNAALGVIYDPKAAAEAWAAGIGATLELSVGGKSGIPGDTPFVGTFKVENISDGQIDATGPFYHGFRLQLGKTVCLRIDDIRVVVVSSKVQTADQAMFRAFGIEPKDVSVLVVKSAVHFRADFTPIAQEIIVATAPGFMPMKIDDLPWKNLPEGIRLGPCGQPFSLASSA